jgi:hypothetical protein
MTPVTLKLARLDQSTRETLGHLTTDEDQVICYCVERPDLGNAPKVSRIPAGTYRVRKTYSPHLKAVTPELLDVPGRSSVRIHWGSYVENSEGCVLTATTFADLNGDGVPDGQGSKKAFDKLMAVTPTEFVLVVSDPTPEQAVAA